jgi:hypothetical protein
MNDLEQRALDLAHEDGAIHSINDGRAYLVGERVVILSEQLAACDGPAACQLATLRGPCEHILAAIVWEQEQRELIAADLGVSIQQLEDSIAEAMEEASEEVPEIPGSVIPVDADSVDADDLRDAVGHLSPDEPVRVMCCICGEPSLMNEAFGMTLFPMEDMEASQQWFVHARCARIALDPRLLVQVREELSERWEGE